MVSIDRSSLSVEDGTLDIYLRDIAGHKALSPLEEAKTAVAIRRGDKRAVERLVTANLRFVVSVARNYQNQGVALSDLINEGNLGLIRAAYRFDEKKNFKFISYAVWWIRQAILQGLADHSRIVKVPLNRVATIHKVGKARVRLEQRFRRLPNDTEVAEELGIKESEVAGTAKIGNRHTSLNAPLRNGGDGGSLMDVLRSESQESPDESASRGSLCREIDKLINTLTERESEVVRIYFGIGDEAGGATLDEIGERLSITRERVRQIKDCALKKLRQSARCYRLAKHALH